MSVGAVHPHSVAVNQHGIVLNMLVQSRRNIKRPRSSSESCCSAASTGPRNNRVRLVVHGSRLASSTLHWLMPVNNRDVLDLM
jgi:hypothetical protein